MENRNNKLQITEQAQAEANRAGVSLAIVRDTVSNAEDSGDYGYCPAAAVPLLFPYGEIVATVNPL